MAIYENKFEIGEKVVIKSLGSIYPLWVEVESLLDVPEKSGNVINTLEGEEATIDSYVLTSYNSSFVYHIVTDKGAHHVISENGLLSTNGVKFIKCDKFNKQCDYFIEGKIYKVFSDGQSNCHTCFLGEKSVVVLVSDTLTDAHTNAFLTLVTEEEYLAQQSPKQQYKTRSKWVKNTSDKPDLPDGTMVKVKFADGSGGKSVVEDLYWGLDILDTDCVVTKWKLADDWNEVVDGQAPDIDDETKVDVKWTDGDSLNTKNHRKGDISFLYVKKWRYAKEKKAK